MQNIKIALINGITGQDGAYLSEYLLSKGYRVIGIRRSNSSSVYRLEYLKTIRDIEIITADLSILSVCNEVIEKYRPDEFYNLAAQSSVSYSFEHPIETINYNIFSVINLLEAIRKVNPEVKFYQASSSEMFGKSLNLPITNESTFHPISPYGISKATGHWLVSQYREAYGLFGSSGILFNHESYLRTDTFFVKKVIKTALLIQKGFMQTLFVGNIDIKRDFGFAKEYVKAIWLILQMNEPGDFQVCSGTSISLRDIAYYVFDSFDIDRDKIIQDPALFRPTDIEDMYGDNSEIKLKGGWIYDLTFYDVLEILMAEEKKNFSVG
ncbi:MAG: GDP-mannose 4,6-dehydratase [Saprospiraceae bacterium]